MKCVAPAPGYLSQTCHASVTKKHLKRFDKELWELWVSILGGIGADKDQWADEIEKVGVTSYAMWRGWVPMLARHIKIRLVLFYG